MALKFYNTLTREIDKFTPRRECYASLYTCGPTVYDYLHVGNWAAYVYWDTLVRILMENNYEVDRVLNITDVGHLVSDADEGEDKLEKGAKREGKDAWEIATFYTEAFLDGMKSLNMIEPKHIAKATDFIDEQLDLIRALKQKGFTYQIDDGIYFDTSKFPTYADFAHLDLADQKAGARVKFNTQKRNPSDFALWKFTPAGQKRDMEWETPVNILDAPTNDKIMGFPGWHLECSAIAINFLGNTIDIHTGGIDHIPVHHTNEIAQSEAATGVRFANYWLHCNHMKIDGTKVSKSLGNGYTLKDLADKGFTPMDLRMFILQGHYRNEGNFTFEGLESARNRLRHWRNVAAIRHQIYDTLVSDEEKNKTDKLLAPYAAAQAVAEAIENDLGTPEALKIVDDVFWKIDNIQNLNSINRLALVNLLETIDRLLGLNLIESTPDIPDEAKELILERAHAREARDFKKSDHIRDALKTQFSITLRDTEFNTIWEYSEK